MIYTALKGTCFLLCNLLTTSAVNSTLSCSADHSEQKTVKCIEYHNSMQEDIIINVLENTQEKELRRFQKALDQLPKEARSLFADEDFQLNFLQICQDYELDPYLMLCLIKKESAFLPDVSNGHCLGLCQINEYSHKSRMERLECDDLYDPYQNIIVAADYLAELISTKRDMTEVLMYYNMPSETARKRYEAGNYSNYAINIQKEAIQLREIAEAE